MNVGSPKITHEIMLVMSSDAAMIISPIND